MLKNIGLLYLAFLKLEIFENFEMIFYVETDKFAVSYIWFYSNT